MRKFLDTLATAGRHALVLDLAIQAIEQIEEELEVVGDDEGEGRGLEMGGFNQGALATLAADLLVKAGRQSEAAQVLLDAFEQSPSMRLFQRLRDLPDVDGGGQAIAVLETRLAGDSPGSQQVVAAASAVRPRVHSG